MAQQLICLSIAGKGRSGTAACSFLISERGWEPAAALSRFTERRMRAGFGQGVSIPSQVRWMTYVDRWVRTGKKYVERSVEILEVHIWGLRDGVKVAVEGFVDEGRTIKTFHVFGPDERVIMSGPGGDDDDPSPSASSSTYLSATSSQSPSPPPAEQNRLVRRNSTDELDRIGSSASTSSTRRADGVRRSSSLRAPAAVESSELDETKRSEEKKITNLKQAADTEPGGSAVLFKSSPATRVILPSNDVNIAIERRTPVFSRTSSSSSGWQVVTAVAHVWFNTYFENHRGRDSRLSPTPSKEPKRSDDHSSSSTTTTTTASKSPAAAGVRNAKDPPLGTSLEEDRSTSEEIVTSGSAEDSTSGVFEITWDEMDGIKGTYNRGIRALDRMAVVWRVASTLELEEKRIDQRASSGSTVAAPPSAVERKGQSQARSLSPRQERARVKDSLIPEPAPREEVRDRQPSPAVPVTLPSSLASQAPCPSAASSFEASEGLHSSTSGNPERECTTQSVSGQQDRGLCYGRTNSVRQASKDEDAGVSRQQYREQKHAAETRELEEQPREALAPTTKISSAAQTRSSTDPSASIAASSAAAPLATIVHPKLVCNEASLSSTDVRDTSDVRASEPIAPKATSSSGDSRTARRTQHIADDGSSTTRNTGNSTTAAATSDATVTLISNSTSNDAVSLINSTSTSPTPTLLTDEADGRIENEMTNPAGDKGLDRDVGIRQVPF